MPDRKLIRRNGIRIAYRVQGSGPLVLLIQGLGMSGPAWLKTPQELVERGFRVATIDNRGTGRSEVSTPPYSMREMAADSAYVIDQLGGPALVAGISLGGMIAQHVALEHPSRVRGLVLAATTVGPLFGRLPKPQVLSTLVRGLLGNRAAMLEMRRYLVHETSLSRDPNLFREFDRTIQSEGVRWQAVTGQLGAAARHNTFFSLRKLTCPVEIVTGDSDVLVPTKNADILARRIPHAQVTTLLHAGHAFPLEYPHAIPEAVARVHG